MHHEQEARTRKGMEERIENLNSMLKAMQSDFAKCAKDNISPCHYCANDETCSGNPQDCNFIWNKHN